MSDIAECEAIIAESESNCREFIHQLQREIERKTTLLFDELENRITSVADNARAEVQESERIQEDYMERTQVFNHTMKKLKAIIDTCASIVVVPTRANKRKSEHFSRVSTSTSPQLRGSRANNAPTLKLQRNQGRVDDDDIGYDGDSNDNNSYAHGSGTYDLDQDDPAAEVSPNQANHKVNRNGAAHASSSSPLSSRFSLHYEDPLDMETQEEKEEKGDKGEKELVVDDPEMQYNEEGIDEQETQWPISSVSAFASGPSDSPEQQGQQGGRDLREGEAREVDALGPSENGGDEPGTGGGVVTRGASSSGQGWDRDAANVDFLVAPAGVMPPFCSSSSSSSSSTLPSSSSASSAAEDMAGAAVPAGSAGAPVAGAKPASTGGGVMPVPPRRKGKGKGHRGNNRGL